MSPSLPQTKYPAADARERSHPRNQAVVLGGTALIRDRSQKKGCEAQKPPRRALCVAVSRSSRDVNSACEHTKELNQCPVDPAQQNKLMMDRTAGFHM